METSTVRMAFRFTPELRRLLEAIAAAYGNITLTAAVQVCIKEQAQRLGLS